MSGRAVPNVGPIQREDIPGTLVYLNQLTSIPVEDMHLLGSAGKVPVSGDLDIAVSSQLWDASALHDYLCSVYGAEKCVYNKGTGVHSYPIEICGDLSKGIVQVDLMYVPNPKWAEFAYFSDPSSKYKGAIRTMLLMGVTATHNDPDIDYFEYDDDGQLMIRAGSTFDLNLGMRQIFQYRKKKKKGGGYLKSMTTVTWEEFRELFPHLDVPAVGVEDDPENMLAAIFGEPNVQPADVATAEQVLELIKQFDKERQKEIFKKAATRVTKGKFELPPEIEAYVK